jgi:hypothetical protein
MMVTGETSVRRIIISGADSAYSGLLSGLLASIEGQAKIDKIDIGILDLGLDGFFKVSLKRRGLSVMAPDWDYSPKLFKEKPPAYFKAMTARPNLRRHFPGYDLYLWIDADAWVQDWAAVKLYIDAALRSGFSATPEVDRSYSAFYSNGPAIRWRYICYRTCFGDAVAERLSPLPIINCGVFAARSDAPHWDIWSRTLGEVFERLREPYFYAEQTALNFIIRNGNLETAFLPSTCNWMCNRALPICSEDGATLLEPHPPFNRIGIIHMTADTKTGEEKLLDVNKVVHVRPLAYMSTENI